MYIVIYVYVHVCVFNSYNHRKAGNQQVVCIYLYMYTYMNVCLAIITTENQAVTVRGSDGGDMEEV